MKHLMIAMLFAFITPFANADSNDHPMSHIIGTEIELNTLGHTIAGKVGSKLIYGNVDENGHQTSKLKVKTLVSEFETEFAHRDGVWGGQLSDGNRSLDATFLRLDRENATYYISFGGEEYRVRVEADDFQNNHFINPTYILEKDGEDIRAQMMEGQACYMYSLHLIFMIFGTFLF
ncbi:MAG: hypothetical protein CL677_02525 [Bdellovibrionaceae bacterium]|nr:hypothetical protein [Pseudobdellovibrionaceae bacterium]|tara:strand:+ start:287988 stop:288515 length:528 start_codon:yes stop_codon:yes gene_type:complete